MGPLEEISDLSSKAAEHHEQLIGRLLWQSADTGVAFVGAMIAMGATVAGIYQLCRRFTTGGRQQDSWNTTQCRSRCSR